MPKRKRIEDELEEKLAYYRKELFRMLKVAKGFERQRMAKRQRDPKSTPDKRDRIEKEIVVLKSIDLQSVANAHLCASLLRIKAVAESPKLPDEVKNGVPKPEISEEERALLHNVTSGLYNQSKVRDVIDKAIADFCRTLQVPVPDKKGKSKKGEKKVEEASRKDSGDQSGDRAKEPQLKTGKKTTRQETKEDKAIPSKAGQNEEEEWNGFSDADEDEDEEEEEEGSEERAVSRFDDRLGGSDSEDSNRDDEYDTANEELDPMEITDESASDQPDAEISPEDDVSDEGDISGTDESADGSEDSEEDEDGDDSDASAASPPPAKTPKQPTKKLSAPTRATETKFLPSLMGGYVSGSESDASDVDVAPAARKNRRGQRARQAIWEKKFKQQAKHLEKQQQASASGRDAGWDLKRGAVEGNSRTPWKQGIKTPFEKKSAANHNHHHQPQHYQAPGEYQPKPQQKKTKKDDEGPLHPSWEARKKAKEAQQTAAFQGKRVVFD